MTVMDSRFRSTRVLFTLILALAMASRLEDVFQPLVDHFSWRESSTAMMADNLPDNGWNPLWPEVSWTGDQPGYQGRELQTLTVVAAVLDTLFGWHDWHGRLVAVVCGTISTIALFLLVSRLHGQRRGLLVAAVYAVLPGAIMIDRSFLPDPAMLALVLVALWFLAEGLYRVSAGWLVAAWATGSLALLAKLPAAAALPAAIYLVMASAPPARRVRHLLWLGAGLASAGAIATSYYLWAIHLGETYPPFHVAGSGWLWEFGFAAFWNAGFYLNTFRWHVETWLWTPAVIVIAVPGFLADVLTRKRIDGARNTLHAPWFFYFWVLGCVIFYVTAAYELRANSWNLHIFNPAVAAFAGAGISALLDGVRFQDRGVRQFIISCGILLSIIATGRRGLEQMKDGTVGEFDHAIGRRLAEVSCVDDLVVTSGTDAGSPVAILYSRRKGWLFPPPEHSPDRNYTRFSQDGPPAVAALDDLVRRGARWFGLVKAGYDKSDPRKTFSSHYAGLISFLREKARVDYEDSDILVFDLAPLAVGAKKSCK